MRLLRSARNDAQIIRHPEEGTTEAIFKLTISQIENVKKLCVFAPSRQIF